MLFQNVLKKGKKMIKVSWHFTSTLKIWKKSKMIDRDRIKKNTKGGKTKSKKIGEIKVQTEK